MDAGPRIGAALETIRAITANANLLRLLPGATDDAVRTLEGLAATLSEQLQPQADAHTGQQLGQVEEKEDAAAAGDVVGGAGGGAGVAGGLMGRGGSGGMGRMGGVGMHMSRSSSSGRGGRAAVMPLGGVIPLSSSPSFAELAVPPPTVAMSSPAAGGKKLGKKLE